MRYLSLFSGIEAASVAWEPLGWECAAVAEIDPFACAVLAHHYPHVPNLGDVSRIGPEEIAALGRIDLVVFGSPCQDLSIAGKRKGLAGERSGLFHIALDIVRWAREYCGCRWALWENVPGAFSSNKGRDFATVVGELAGVDLAVPPKGWGTEGAAVGSEGMVEWAVLDAQWFGVAQRRRRVFALADFGDWASRPPVLLEPQSLRGDSPPRREPGQGASADVAPGVGASGREWPQQTASTLNASFGKKLGLEDQHINQGAPLFVPVEPYTATAETVGALACNTGPRGHDAGNFACNQAVNAGHVFPVVEPYTLAIRGREGGATLEARQDGVSNAILTPTGGRSGVGVGAVAYGLTTEQTPKFAEDLALTLTKQSPTGGGQPQAVAVCATGEVFHTLRADGFDASEDGTGRGGGGAVVFQPRYYSGRERMGGEPSDVVHTLSSLAGQGDSSPHVAHNLQVRRLTPTECERLQGFPDGWTAIPYRGKPASDGPRYKAIGNSMAVPVMAWIGQQIDIAASGLI